MPSPQIIRSPSGDELVVLPRAEYEALLAAAEDAEEDAADLAMLDRRRAEAAGPDGLLPAEVSQSILKGDSLLKALRRWRGLTQTELAEAAGLGQGYLSDLEARHKQGSPETLARLAAALGIPRPWLVSAEGNR